MSPFSPEYFAKLRTIAAEADAIAAPSVADAARHWHDDDGSLDDMVRRGVAVDLGEYPRTMDDKPVK